MSFLKNPSHPEEPVCKNLRTRGSYIPDMRNAHYMEVFEPYVPHYCIKTLHVVGPDDSPVCLEECDKSRLCYEPLLKSKTA